MIELVDPVVRPEGMRRLTEHVHMIPDESRRGVPNIGVVVGRRKALIVDTGMGADNGSIVLKAALRVAGMRPLLLVTTHVHPEHDLGAHVFPAHCLMIRARSQVREIDETGMSVADDFRAKSPHYRRRLEGARFRPADIVFDDTLAVELGGVQVSLTAMGPNHTGGDTIAFVHDEGVLFSGDIVMTGAPAFASPRSSLRNWLGSLDRVRSMRPATIVPSHGPIGDADMIDRYDAHLRGIHHQVVQGIVEGADLAAITRAVLDARGRDFGDLERLEGAVRAAYREESEWRSPS